MPPVMDMAEAEVSGVASDSDNGYNTDTQSNHDDETMADSNIAESANGEVKKKFDPKDPARPRRKKARRACYACQRAHLTCGDERPCLRCVKRGLAEQCQDGVRKKAKYLHDAPVDALGPVLGPGYNNRTTVPTRPNGHRHPSSTASEESSTPANFFGQANPSQYPGMYPPSQAALPGLPDALSFGSQQSPVSPTFQSPHSTAQMGGGTTAPNMMNMANLTTGLSFDANSPVFDPSNPLIFNYDIRAFNDLKFQSNYSAIEWGMLSNMSGAAETSTQDPSLGGQSGGDVHFGQQNAFDSGNQFPFDSAAVLEQFMSLDDANLNGIPQQGNLQHGLPHAYAIAARPTSLQSPSTENNSPQATTGFDAGYDGSPTATNFTINPAQPHGSQQQQQQQQQQLHRQNRHNPQQSSIAKLAATKRKRDPSYIYESVREPYPYVRAFHRLMLLLQARLPSTKTLTIAKCMASIRAPFISCTRTLNREDLVFMEKSFQRALFEYEEFMHAGSAPAVAIRRTGEVAGVNKEFTALTGWTQDVLLGHKPNLNINTGISSSASNSGSTGRGTGETTPRIRTQNEQQQQQNKPTASAASGGAAGDAKLPVFLAELMDEDSVVAFYQDFSELAFNNSRGRVTRKCRLLKYRTQESVVEGSLAGSSSALAARGGQQGDASSNIKAEQQVTKQSILSNRVARIDGEHGISKLEKDGKLECSYTWAIKRDTFDIPMLIVVNFLPCYYRTHSQLAV